jgi:Zn-finger nucleic acid-binding protein
MAACPKCKTTELEPPPGRASRLLRCDVCHGTWFPEDEARLEAVAGLLAADSTIRPGGDEDRRTGLCPEGHGILIRALVQVEDPFHLERCSVCHGIWFDKGEWNRLAESHLLDHLERLWDPAMRFSAMKVEDPRQDLVRRIGSPAVEMIETLATALRSHDAESTSAALAYLERELNL